MDHLCTSPHQRGAAHLPMCPHLLHPRTEVQGGAGRGRVLRGKLRRPTQQAGDRDTGQTLTLVRLTFGNHSLINIQEPSSDYDKNHEPLVRLRYSTQI